MNSLIRLSPYEKYIATPLNDSISPGPTKPRDLQHPPTVSFHPLKPRRGALHHGKYAVRGQLNLS
eukprot:1326593-Amorphochlora_amoeboformis.AAC.1